MSDRGDTKVHHDGWSDGEMRGVLTKSMLELWQEDGEATRLEFSANAEKRLFH